MGKRERLQESNILPGAASSFSGTAAAAGGSLSAGRLGRGGGGMVLQLYAYLVRAIAQTVQELQSGICQVPQQQTEVRI